MYDFKSIGPNCFCFICFLMVFKISSGKESFTYGGICRLYFIFKSIISKRICRNNLLCLNRRVVFFSKNLAKIFCRNFHHQWNWFKRNLCSRKSFHSKFNLPKNLINEINRSDVKTNHQQKKSMLKVFEALSQKKWTITMAALGSPPHTFLSAHRR